MKPFYHINEMCYCHVLIDKKLAYAEVKVIEIYQIKQSLKKYKISPTYKVRVVPQVITVNNCKYSVPLEKCVDLTVAQIALRKKLKSSNFASFTNLLKTL
jgi:hypothetical protein